MDKLIFLHNELMSTEVQRQMGIPMQFVSFAIAEGKMYKHYHNPSNFIIGLKETKQWGNKAVYGAIFLCKDFEFYSAILDAFHACSMSTLTTNHARDFHHRSEVNVIPISFDSLEDLSRLKYREKEAIKAQIYKGNVEHPKISCRLNNHNSFRIIDGIDARNFKQLYWEVTDEQAEYERLSDYKRLCGGL